MSIFDGRHDFFNIPSFTLGGEHCWDFLDLYDGYELQQNQFTHHCRILNSYKIRIAWGLEGPMRAEFERLKGTRRVRRGDVIGVHRLGGLYDHYGIYESDDCVYEYGADICSTADIHITTLSRFLNGASGYFILIFPEICGVPGKLDIGCSFNVDYAHKHGVVDSFLTSFVKQIKYEDQYRLYSPEETLRRARSRLGETQYNLLMHNCEHFAIWCKTGIEYSEQTGI